MTGSVLEAGPNLPVAEWKKLVTRAIFDHCKWDPQCGDHAVLARFPLILDASTLKSLALMAEELSGEALEAEKEILQEPALLRRLSIPRNIRRVLEKAEPEGSGTPNVRVMRFDFHYTREGWRISEVNADVPGGYIEASGWNGLFACQFSGVTAPPDPTQAYVRAICQLVSEGSLIALAHATVYSEDGQVMVHLAKEMRRQGLNPCLISPAHLRWHEGRAGLESDFAAGSPAMIVRLLPAEWLPAVCSRGRWAPWFSVSKTPLSNPGHALILQSKRFPLLWDELSTELPTWRRLLPVTYCPSRTGQGNLDEFVLKPAFGRVGEDVGMKGVSGDAEYARIVQAARTHPAQWVVQRRFETVPVATEDGPVYPCIGIFTVNGKMAGAYGRAAFTPLVDQNALDAAVLVRGNAQGRVQ